MKSLKAPETSMAQLPTILRLKSSSAQKTKSTIAGSEKFRVFQKVCKFGLIWERFCLNYYFPNYFIEER